jgi:hypothetical protein
MQRWRQERRSAGTGVVEACRLAGTQRVRSSRIGWLKEPPFHPRSQPPTRHPLHSGNARFLHSHLAIGNSQLVAAARHQPERVCLCPRRSPPASPASLVARWALGGCVMVNQNCARFQTPFSHSDTIPNRRPAAYRRPLPLAAAPSGPSLISVSLISLVLVMVMPMLKLSSCQRSRLLLYTAIA